MLDKLKVPPRKMLISGGISLMALLLALLLNYLKVTDASPVVVAVLGPIVNYLRKVHQNFGDPSLPDPPPSMPASP